MEYGYLKQYPPMVDAYGNVRLWAGYRGAFVGTTTAPGLGAAPLGPLRAMTNVGSRISLPPRAITPLIGSDANAGGSGTTTAIDGGSAQVGTPVPVWMWVAGSTVVLAAVGLFAFAAWGEI